MGVMLTSSVIILHVYLWVLMKNVAVAIPVNYKNCGPEGSVKEFDLSPCTTQPCNFHHGINVTVKLDFVSQTVMNNLTTEVYGLIGGVPVHFPLPNTNACERCGVDCPLKAGQTYYYTNTLPVLKQYPSIKLVVKWQLVDINKNIAACVLFPMSISDNK